jgi:hypothetical protein
MAGEGEEAVRETRDRMQRRVSNSFDGCNNVKNIPQGQLFDRY